MASGSKPSGVLLAALLSVAALLAGPGSGSGAAAEKKKAPGWLYIHAYLTEAETRRPGVAIAPFYFYDASGRLVPSGRPDGIQVPGRYVEVEPGEYYVVAGRMNVGLTRSRYVVESGRVTVIPTGFIQVVTWPRSEQPHKGCSPWDATMHVLAHDGKEYLPIFSNAGSEYKTAEFGLIQLPIGKYQVLWHEFRTEVEVKQHQVYRLPLGISGPLPQPSARLSMRQGEGADNPTVALCEDGPTHVLAGKYWQSSIRKLDVYPHEERVWVQVEVPPLDESGYRQRPPDPLRWPLLRPEVAGPFPSPTRSMNPPLPPEAAGSASDGNPALPGGPLEGSGINWDAPP